MLATTPLTLLRISCNSTTISACRTSASANFTPSDLLMASTYVLSLFSLAGSVFFQGDGFIFEQYFSCFKLCLGCLGNFKGPVTFGLADVQLGLLDGQFRLCRSIIQSGQYLPYLDRIPFFSN